MYFYININIGRWIAVEIDPSIGFEIECVEEFVGLGDLEKSEREDI